MFTEAWVEQKEEQKGRSAVCAYILLKVLMFLLCFIAELLYAWGLDCVFGLVYCINSVKYPLGKEEWGEGEGWGWGWGCIAFYKTGVLRVVNLDTAKIFLLNNIKLNA